MRHCALLLSLLVTCVYGVERPVFVGETLLPERTFNSSRQWLDQTVAPEELWQRTLIQMQLFSPDPDSKQWAREDCRYDTALQILQQIRSELGENNNYQLAWAANQARVLAVCELRPEKSLPVEPSGQDLPQRAASDYLYQLASWHFYNRDYQQALELFQKVEALPAAAVRGFASYMTLRSMANLGAVDEAYIKAEQLLAQPNLSNRELVANYRFILMSRTNYYSSPGPELAEQHLSWLLQVIRQAPEKATNIQRSRQDMQDAIEQLAGYFTGHVKGLGVDWWLQDQVPPEARLQAVQKLAKNNELVDWLQAKQASNVLSADWLWALHQPDAAYWQQNQAIVQHAWQRWQQTGHAEWLGIAASRVHPQDPLAPTIISASDSQFVTNWKGETAEYRQWLFELWSHNLRLRIGRDDLAGAMSLVRAHSDYEQLVAQNSYDRATPPYAYSAALRWFVYQGQKEQARQWLGMLLELHKGSYGKWRMLLAQNWRETIEPVLGGQNTAYRSTDNDLEMWEAIMQLLPARTLSKLAENPQLIRNFYRPALARAAFTRAILLEQDEYTTDRYAAQVARLQPELRELVLQYGSSREHDAYVDLLLHVPRMRPLPYVEYEDTQRQVWPDYDLPKGPTAIDTFNHNDNNWWCRVAPDDLAEQVFTTVKIVPAALRDFFDTQDLEQQPDIAAYLAKQRQLVAEHPFHQHVDLDELQALAQIPSAPQYLSEAVNARERFTDWLPTRSEQERNEHAGNLHRAIRTTRYGCQNNGSHASYSKASFVLLKQYYGDTLWAKATPFWFGCSHFRHGCPLPESVAQKQPEREHEELEADAR